MMNLRMELFVHNLQVSSDFYCQVLGFEKVKETENYIGVKNGSVTFGLGTFAKLPNDHPLSLKAQEERIGIGVEIVLDVDDVNAYYKRIVDAKYPINETLVKRSWGATDFRIIDPNGYYIRITSKD